MTTPAQRAKSRRWQQRPENRPKCNARAKRFRAKRPGYSTKYVRAYRAGKEQL